MKTHGLDDETTMAHRTWLPRYRVGVSLGLALAWVAVATHAFSDSRSLGPKSAEDYTIAGQSLQFRRLLGAPGGPSRSPGDKATPLPAHLRVEVRLQSMENVIVAGDGVTYDPAEGYPAAIEIFWLFHSPVATEERYCPPLGGGCDPRQLPIPLADELRLYDDANRIYDALVVDGCSTTPTFPLTLESWLEPVALDQEILGHFSGADDSTIQPNGYWHLSYILRATDSGGNVSDITVQGYVSALCTNLDSFWE